MPELPEVETVARGIRPYLLNQRIVEVQVLRPQLRIKIPANFKKLVQGNRVVDLKRKAKYILISLDNGYTIIIHLGMSGRLSINAQTQEKIFHHKKQQFKKHDHLFMKLDSGAELIYNDTRKFGLITICETHSLTESKHLKKLGQEPLAKDFSPEKFYQLIHFRNKNIKAVLMDSSLIVGIGNIYACEALFKAKIHPERLAAEIKQEEARALYKAIVQTLEAAIKAGGSTLKDYAKADGSQGYFQHEFLVYGQENQSCKKCKKKIIRIKQNGRSTFLCPSCQTFSDRDKNSRANLQLKE